MEMKKILVVADEESDRDRLCRLVDEAGFRALVAASGAEILDMVNDEQPALILLDIVGDEMDGFKTCRELSMNPYTRHIPVVVIRDQQKGIDELWAEQQGASGVIHKPCSRDEVLSLIHRLT